MPPKSIVEILFETYFSFLGAYFFQVGGATAIGEQPIKGLLDPACGARMTVGEVLTNLVFARISSLRVSVFSLE